MTEPQWVSLAVVMAIHEAQLAEHGGTIGVREQGLLESALARPRQIYAYGDDPDLLQLAAAYAFGLAKNHAFVDGNKRTAWVVCALFLELNGRYVTATQGDVVTTMLGVASGEIAEREFAAWLGRNSE
jgi:death-on-curing protein